MSFETNYDVFKFLEYYQNEPVIWNPKDVMHKDKKNVRDAWVRISDEMEIPVPELKKKKEALMATFRQHLKKKRASISSGCSEEDVYKPVWIYYEMMETFLKDVYECPSKKKKKPPPSSWQSSTRHSYVSSQEIKLEKTSPQATFKKNIQNKRKREEENETITELPRLEKNSINNPRYNEDEFYYFGQNVAAQLRSLPLNNALDLQAKIQMMISEERLQLSA